MIRGTKKIQWHFPMKKGSGYTNPTGTVLAVRPAGSKGKRTDRIRVVIYKKLMKHARLIEGDKLILGMSEEQIVIARQSNGYTLCSNGGNKGPETACSINVTGVKIDAAEFYTMQDIDIEDDGSIVVLRSAAQIAVNE